MGLIKANGVETRELLKEGVILLNFSGQGCKPCMAFHDVLIQVGHEMPFLKIINVDAKENMKFAREYKVLGVPSNFILKDGEIVEQFVGVKSVEEVIRMINEHMYQ